MSAPQDPNFQAPPPPQPTPATEPQASRPTKLLWPIAIGVFVLGLIFIGGGIAKLLAGGIGTGAALCFLGIVLFALSFIRLPSVPNPEPPMSWFEKVTGIFYEPSRVFRNLRFHPAWLGAFLAIWVLTTIYSTAFVQRITPERIVDHTVEKVAQMGPPFAPPPEAIDKMRTDQMDSFKNPVQRVGNVLKSLVGIFVFSGLIPAALILLGVLVFGGRINFWQALAVVFYSALPVIFVQKILGLVILYLKAPEDLHPVLNAETTLQDNLGILLSPAEHPVLFVMASFIGLTSFYWLWLRAKGIHFGGTRVSTGQGWGVAITLWLLLLIFVVIITALFPGFIS
ncbi:MAG TPA: YIP1 family protein [Pyrinomonadaceae bacterium]|nr:YIP1 family protein [Pyrinomonadaceae bacterium]